VGSDPLYIAYHDREWGVPVHDERRLYEMLVLEGAQAGLSWSTILRKRDGYRAAFAGFDPARVAGFGDREIAALLDDPGIVRNRRKILSAIENARCVIRIREQHESLDAYLWGLVGGKPTQNAWTALSEVPAATERSTFMSKRLKADGFGFVGPTTCYAFMQAVGMVNDHVTGCFRHDEVRALG
jgi:DNA-3-methyladenine glycosylase I